MRLSRCELSDLSTRRRYERARQRAEKEPNIADITRKESIIRRGRLLANQAINQYRVLCAIIESSKSVREIARELNMDEKTVSLTLHSLLKYEIVERSWVALPTGIGTKTQWSMR